MESRSSVNQMVCGFICVYVCGYMNVYSSKHATNYNLPTKEDYFNPIKIIIISHYEEYF